MKNEHIVSFSAEQLRSRVLAGTESDWNRIASFTDDDIEGMAQKENARLGIADDWYKDAVAVWPDTASELALEVLQSKLLDAIRVTGVADKSSGGDIFWIAPTHSYGVRTYVRTT